jgi:hypothetical protein
MAIAEAASSVVNKINSISALRNTFSDSSPTSAAVTRTSVSGRNSATRPFYTVNSISYGSTDPASDRLVPWTRVREQATTLFRISSVM